MANDFGIKQTFVPSENHPEFERTFSRLEKVVRRADSLGVSHIFIANSCNRIAEVYFYRGNYELSLYFALKGMDFFQKNGLKDQLCRNYIFIGDIFRGNGFYAKSLEYLDKAIVLASQLGSDTLLCMTYDRKAATFFEMYPSGRERSDFYAQKALALAHQVGLKRQEMSVLMILGGLEAKLEHSGMALEYYHKALGLVSAAAPFEESLILVNMAREYIKMGEEVKGQAYSEKALHLAESYQIPQYVRLSALVLYEFFNEKGDYKNAIEYFRLFYWTQAGLRNQKTQMALQDFNRSLEMEKQMAQNRELVFQQNLNVQKMKFFYLLGILLIFILSGFFVFALIQKRQGKKMEALLVQLDNSNRVLRGFFSIIAHDLRSPFNSIIGFSSLLKESRSLTPEEIESASHSIHSVSQTAFQMLEKLLEWSRIHSGTIVPDRKVFLLNELAKKVLEVVQPDAQRKNIRLLVSSNQEYAYADEAMILSVILNLMSNAIKFTSSGGWVAIQFIKESHRVGISIEDSGLGISSENLKKLFTVEKNYRSHGTEGEKGSGLGLVIARDYVLLNKGSIEVTSKEGQGTRFVVFLPKE